MGDPIEKQLTATPETIPELCQRQARKASEDEFQSAIIGAAENLAMALAAIKQTNSPVGTGQNIVSVEQGFKDRDYFSGKVSEIARQLGFAGIGVIWVFKVGTGENQAVPITLVPAALLLVLGLSFDFIHYLTATTLWHILTKRAQQAGRGDFVAPPWINTPAWLLFIAKTTAIGSAYVYLIVYLTLAIVVKIPVK